VEQEGTVAKGRSEWNSNFSLDGGDGEGEGYSRTGMPALDPTLVSDLNRCTAPVAHCCDGA
jgi:hypothetical protein